VIQGKQLVLINVCGVKPLSTTELKLYVYERSILNFTVMSIKIQNSSTVSVTHLITVDFILSFSNVLVLPQNIHSCGNSVHVDVLPQKPNQHKRDERQPVCFELLLFL